MIRGLVGDTEQITLKHNQYIGFKVDLDRHYRAVRRHFVPTYLRNRCLFCRSLIVQSAVEQNVATLAICDLRTEGSTADIASEKPTDSEVPVQMT